MKQNESDIWVAPFCDVAKYEKTRDNVVLNVAKNGNDIAVSSSTTLDPYLFDSSVTVAFKGDWENRKVKVCRGDEEIVTTVKGNLLLWEMNPTDSVVLTVN